MWKRNVKHISNGCCWHVCVVCVLCRSRKWMLPLLYPHLHPAIDFNSLRVCVCVWKLTPGLCECVAVTQCMWVCVILSQPTMSPYPSTLQLSLSVCLHVLCVLLLLTDLSCTQEGKNVTLPKSSIPSTETQGNCTTVCDCEPRFVHKVQLLFFKLEPLQIFEGIQLWISPFIDTTEPG